MNTFKRKSSVSAEIQRSGTKQAWLPEKDSANSDKISALQCLKPIIVTMTVCGMYFKSFSSSGIFVSGEKTQPLLKSSFIFNIVLICLMWLHILRMVLTFFLGEMVSEETVFKVTGLCWFTLCACNVILMIKASHPRTGSLHKFYKHWTEDVCQKLRNLNMEEFENKLCFRLNSGLVIGWSVVLFNVVAVILIYTVSLGERTDIMGVLFITPLPVNTGTKIMAIIAHTIFTLAWIMPMVFFASLSIFVKHGFQTLTSNVEREIEKNPSMFLHKLQRFRKAHLSLCKSVDLLDNEFGYFFAVNYLINIPHACFLLYSIVNTSMDILTQIIILFWLSGAIGAVAFTSVFAATLNKAAHSPLEYIHDMNLTDVNLETLGQVTLFLSKLTGPAVGFTLLTVLTITNELLLTVAGVFLTYFFLLLQFKI